MALSDDEQRTLDEMEAALRRGDPGFAAHVSMTHVRRRRWLAVAALLLLGTVVLLTGLVVTAVTLPVGIALSIVGLLMMLAVTIGAFRHRRTQIRAARTT